MSALLYILFKLLNMIDEPDDWVNVCHLLALDSIAFVLLLHWWQRRKQP